MIVSANTCSNERRSMAYLPSDTVVSVTGRRAGRRAVVGSALMDKYDADMLTSTIYYADKGKRYLSVTVSGKSVLLHRWIMGITDSSVTVDHIDGNSFNNTRRNLRPADRETQMANSVKTGNPYGRGVSKTRNGRFRVTARVRGKQYSLGAYSTPEEAAEVSHEWRLENMPGYNGRMI